MIGGQDTELNSVKGKAAIREYDKTTEELAKEYKKKLEDLDKKYRMKSELVKVASSAESFKPFDPTVAA